MRNLAGLMKFTVLGLEGWVFKPNRAQRVSGWQGVGLKLFGA